MAPPPPPPSLLLGNLLIIICCSSSAVLRWRISSSLNRRRIVGFLQHWPQLKELTLIDTSMNENDLMECIKHLVQPKKQKGSTGLYSLTLGRVPRLSDDFPPSLTITAAVVDALYASRLPFFKLEDWYGTDVPLDPAIKAQLLRNQLLFRFANDLERVPATSIRLFICGDPYAGNFFLFTNPKFNLS